MRPAPSSLQTIFSYTYIINYITCRQHYFNVLPSRDIIEFTKGLDESRAVTVKSDFLSANCVSRARYGNHVNVAASWLWLFMEIIFQSADGDVLVLNANSVIDSEKPEMIKEGIKQLETKFNEIMETYHKPLLIAEYGLTVWDLVYAEVQSPVSKLLSFSKMIQPYMIQHALDFG